MSIKTSNTNGNGRNIEVNSNQEINAMNITKLKEVAKDLGVKGYSKFKSGQEEEELRALINEFTNKVVAPSELGEVEVFEHNNEAISDPLDAFFGNNVEEHKEYTTLEVAPSTQPSKEKVMASLEQQVKEFMGKKHKPETTKEDGNKVVRSSNGWFDDVVVVRENRLKIYVEQIQPQTEHVDGYILKGVYEEYFDDQNKKVRSMTGQTLIKGTVRMSVNTPFYRWVKAGHIEALTIVADDGADMSQLYAWLSRKLEPKNKIILGNKNSDPVLGIGAIDVWEKLTGDEISRKNPFKPVFTFMTPMNYRVTNYKNATIIDGVPVFKIRLINPEKTKLHPVKMKDGSTKMYGGHPKNDGCLITDSTLFFLSIGEKNKARDEEGYEAKINRTPGCYQLRLEGIDPVTKHDVPAVKCLVAMRPRFYDDMCRQYKFNTADQDGIMTLDNVKNQKGKWKHGDIMHIPISGFRVVNIKLGDGSSSFGPQSIRGPGDDFRLMFRKYGAVERAALLKKAQNGDLEAIKMIIDSDKEATQEDTPLMYIKIFGYARPDNVGTYHPLRFKSMYTQLMSRYYTYLQEHVFKCEMWDHNFYLIGNEELDEMEAKHYQETGVWKRFFRLAVINDVRKEVKLGKKWNSKRDPYGYKGSSQGGTPVGYNGLRDAFEASWGYIWAILGDVDGDTVSVMPDSEIEFPFSHRPLDKEGDFVSAIEDGGTITDICIRSYANILKNKDDTGILDNLGRKLIFENWEAGRPLTDVQVTEMWTYIQKAIEGMKHLSQDEDDAREYLIKTFGVNGKTQPTKKTSLQFRALHKSAGQSFARGVPSVSMEELNKVFNQLNKYSPQNPYNEVLAELKGSNPRVHHEDSGYMRDQCQKIWNGIKGRINGVKFPWTVSDITIPGDALIDGGQLLPYLDIWIKGEKAENEFIRENYKEYSQRQERKELFADLTRRSQEYIRTAADAVISKYRHLIADGSVADFTTAYLRHLHVYTGTVGFRSGISLKQTPYSLSGSVFWYFPMEECLLFLAEKINPDNPWLHIAKDSARKSAEKRIKREAERLLKEQTEEDND